MIGSFWVSHAKEKRGWRSSIRGARPVGRSAALSYVFRKALARGRGGEGAAQSLSPTLPAIFWVGEAYARGGGKRVEQPPFPPPSAVLIMQSIFRGSDNQRGRLLDNLVFGGQRVERSSCGKIEGFHTGLMACLLRGNNRKHDDCRKKGKQEGTDALHIRERVEQQQHRRSRVESYRARPGTSRREVDAEQGAA